MRLPKRGVLVIGTDRDSSRNYMGKVMALARQARPGEALDVTVVHDDHCPILHGRGYCACDPVVVRGALEATDAS
ncbi:MAG: hypothetical protein EOO74_12090 [Myxococcales bacterium]|nr:MAG: hypothetical protein EOO74_12090 [Myxococcales bacterium]